jgi:phosphoribosylformylglycinamidine synthase
MVGLIEKAEDVTTQWFKDDGDTILLLGAPVDRQDPLQGLGGSAYLQVIHGQKTGLPPRCPLDIARTLHTTLLGLIRAGGVKSAHDCSEGGLAVAVAECCISQLEGRHTPRLRGAMIDLDALGEDAVPPDPAPDPSATAEPTALAPPSVRLDALLFGETQSRVVLTCAPLDTTKILERARLMGVPARVIGVVGGDALVWRSAAGETKAPVAELHDLWWNAIGRVMDER